jgi:hypothetical protein
MSLEEAARAAGVTADVVKRDLPLYMERGQWRVPTAVVRVYLEWQRDRHGGSFEAPPLRRTPTAN